MKQDTAIKDRQKEIARLEKHQQIIKSLRTDKIYVFDSGENVYEVGVIENYGRYSARVKVIASNKISYSDSTGRYRNNISKIKYDTLLPEDKKYGFHVTCRELTLEDMPLYVGSNFTSRDFNSTVDKIFGRRKK